MNLSDEFRASTRRFLLACFATLCMSLPGALAYEPQTLTIGSQAPDFDLLGVGGRRYTLASFADKSVLVVLANYLK